MSLNKNQRKKVLLNKNKSSLVNNSSSKIKVYQTNARSLRNKFTELSSLVASQNFDIICITESWVSESVNRDFLSEYELNGYNAYFYQRENRQGGGIILYVKSKLVG